MLSPNLHKFNKIMQFILCIQLLFQLGSHFYGKKKNYLLPLLMAESHSLEKQLLFF